jgi:hypothetical protein
MIRGLSSLCCGIHPTWVVQRMKINANQRRGGETNNTKMLKFVCEILPGIENESGWVTGEGCAGLLRRPLPRNNFVITTERVNDRFKCGVARQSLEVWRRDE